MNGMVVSAKTAVDKYELDEDFPHIETSESLCSACTDKPCLTVCPAGVYSEQEGKIVAEWAACLECGTCRFACGSRSGLNWKYPRGSFGIIYRYA